MALYSTFKYGSGVKYGVSTQGTLRWAVQIDWYDNDFETALNESGRCIAMDWERGRDTFLESNTNGIRFPSVGRAALTLDNNDKRYDAWNVSGPYYGYIYPGHKVRIGVRTPYSGTSIIWRFSGRLSDIKPTGWRNGYVDLTVEDAMQWLYDQDVDIDVQQTTS